MSKISKIKTAVLTATQNVSPSKNMFKTEIEARAASAGPPLGPLLGKYGLNIGNFCKDFNERTKNIKPGVPLPVTVKIKPDRSYDLRIHTPPVEYYLFQAAGIDRGRCGEEPIPIGKLTIKHVYEIAKIKHEDPYEKYQLYELPQVVRRIIILAQERGIEVVRNLDADEYNNFLTDRFAYLDAIDKQLEAERLTKLQKV